MAEAIKTNPPILFGTYDRIRDAFHTPELKDHAFFKDLAGPRLSPLKFVPNYETRKLPTSR